MTNQPTNQPPFYSNQKKKKIATLSHLKYHIYHTNLIQHENISGLYRVTQQTCNEKKKSKQNVSMFELWRVRVRAQRAVSEFFLG